MFIFAFVNYLVGDLRFFQKTLIQKSLARIQAKVIVYDPVKNEIVQ
jgi:hypothetical protein